MSEEKKQKTGPAQKPVSPVRPGRNDPCHCGSGKKYKKCHLLQDEEADRKARKTGPVHGAVHEGEKKDDKKFVPDHSRSKIPHFQKPKGGVQRPKFNRKVGEG